MNPARIQLIQNTEGRLEQLKPLFQWLSSRGHGKLTPAYYVTSTELRCAPKNVQEAIFTQVQDDAYTEGFKYNCYCFNL